MASHVFAGILLALTVSFVGLALFFVIAWLQRRQEGEYLVFSLQTLSLAVYSGAVTRLTFWSDGAAYHPHWQFWADIGTAGVVCSAPFGLHFAARFARLAVERLVARVAYATAAFYLAVLAADRWWVGPPDQVVVVPTIFGDVASPVLRPTLLGGSFYVLATLVALAMVGMVTRAVVGGRRDGVSALIGAWVLAASGLHDALLGAGVHQGISLSPFGYVAFSYGVGLTLVQRYGSLSVDLERTTHDLRGRTEELDRSYQSLQAAQAQLVRNEQLAVVGELAGVIAHEVRNPLAIIANAVAGLRKQALGDDDRATLLKIIDEEGSRLNRIVGDLVAFSRPPSAERHPISLCEVAARAVAAAAAPDEPRLRIDVQCDPDTPQVWCDPDLARRLFANLIADAVEAMHGDGALVVRIAPETRAGEPGASVEVEDTGEGIDPRAAPPAGAPFFSNRPSGTGLGLAIVERIVTAHAGSMVVESRAAEGTLVRIFWPVGAAPRAPDAPLSGEGAPHAAPTSGEGAPHAATPRDGVTSA